MLSLFYNDENFCRESVCSFKLHHSHPIPFRVPQLQTAAFVLWPICFYPQFAQISVSPLSNFPDKNAASAGMSQCWQIKFFTMYPFSEKITLQGFSRCGTVVSILYKFIQLCLFLLINSYPLLIFRCNSICLHLFNPVSGSVRVGDSSDRIGI